ncbi:MAG: hypothetical protein IIB44_09125 [Candidatus Marinimicrobia bacterium]|nr:hypothetical protein [Candidatus Neomarinimicrobiota bacterium]
MADELQDDEQIDFQKQFLFKKIDELVEGIGPGYGEALMEELISRMERTVALFHDEVAELLDTLKSRREERDARLKDLFEKGDIEKEVEISEPLSSAEVEMSEYERKLEERAAKASIKEGTSKKVDEEKPKKRGFFSKKK